ncbi:hypothetical protein QBC37DRAFT_377568 [Rhypophila decipiens]|uniref:Uncharacterized protein n=1 Tax=Rhypophila decipiens TaxID=261697 RepID=A0AAN7B6G7_9PEZI|nr:hypothetical protein QBC37DRAFT_377568 [Rhypophila decipiens]
MASSRVTRSNSRTPSLQSRTSIDSDTDSEMISALNTLDLTHRVSPRGKKRLSAELFPASETDPEERARPKKRLSTVSLRLGLGTEDEIDLDAPRQTRKRATGADAPKYKVGQPSSSRAATWGTKAQRKLKYPSRKLPEKPDLPAVSRPPPRVPTPPCQDIIDDNGKVPVGEWLTAMEGWYRRLREKALDPETRRIELPTLDWNLHVITLKLQDKFSELRNKSVVVDGDGDMDMGVVDQQHPPARLNKAERKEMKAKVVKLFLRVKEARQQVQTLERGEATWDQGVFKKGVPNPNLPGTFLYKEAIYDWGEEPMKEARTVERDLRANDGEDVVMEDKQAETEQGAESADRAGEEMVEKEKGADKE